MLAISERPPYRILVVLVAVCAIGTLCHVSHHGRWDRAGIAKLRELADQQYRAGDFARAELTTRVAAASSPHRLAEKLHVIASFYHQLGDSYRLGMGRASSEALEQLDLAIQFDGMLGGAFTDELHARKSRVWATIGPM